MMKTKIFTLTTFLICWSIVSFAQDKAPIAEDDFYNVFSLRSDTLTVLENDFAYDEHPFKLLQVMPPEHGEMNWNDSLVFYTPNIYFKGIDSLTYRIIDLENNLMSELATVFLQVDNKGMDTLSVNNIHCRINSCGTQFWNMEDDCLFEVPANSGLNSMFSQSLWIGGFDQEEMLHLAGDTYRFGSDFFPGPVVDSTAYTIDYDISWNRVWMLLQSDIDYHRAHFQDAGYEMIENIAEWPSVVDPSYAPFFDIDDNDEYNPAYGDFPIIKGDQAIYFIFNDDRDLHTNSGGKKNGVEIHAMYYAYEQADDSTLNNTIFASYKIINKSENNYHDYHIGFYNDFDIGCPWDEYIGTDTVLNALYAYNATPIDCSYQYPENYGSHTPAIAFTALDFDMTSTITFYGYGNVPTCDPQEDFEFFNYMKSVWRDSTHLTVGGEGYGGTIPINYIYPGNPVTGDGWSEITANNEISDRRGLLSSGPYSLNSGGEIELEFALVVARAFNGLNLPNLNSVELLKERIENVRNYYDNSMGEQEVEQRKIKFEVYPNPFVDYITITTDINIQKFKYSVFDILGEELIAGAVQSNNSLQLKLKNLNKGIYFIRISDGEKFTTRKIVKQ